MACLTPEPDEFGRPGGHQQSRYPVALGVLIGFVLLIGAAAVLHRRLVRPIEQLSARLRHATAHSSVGPIEVAGPREIVDLVEDVNSLSNT